MPVLFCGRPVELTTAFLSPSVARVALVGTASPYDTPIRIYGTSNSGRTWSSTRLTVRGEVSPGYRLTYSDPQHGWLLVNRGVGAGQNPYILLRTADGGGHWKVLARPNRPTPKANTTIPDCDCTTAITFRTESTGWATGTGFAVPNPVWLYVSRDGGVTWRQQHLTVPPGFQDVLETMRPAFFGPRGVLPAQLINKRTSNGFVVYRTTDGGSSWHPTKSIVIPQGQGYPPYASFADPNHGWVGSGNVLYRTTDGGLDWRRVSVSRNFSEITQIDFVNRSIGFAITASQVPRPLLETTDAGLHWHSLVALSGGVPPGSSANC